MIEKKYIINSDKIDKDIKICLFADIHYSKIFKIKKFDLIKKSLINNKPDYICIPGDLLDLKNIYDDKNKLDIFLSFFKDISLIAPVYISLGNHDLNKSKGEFYKKWLNELDKIDNINILYNSFIEVNNIRFIGFNPSLKYYFDKKKNRKDENELVFIKEFNDNMTNYNNDKLNILLCHSPVCIFNTNVIDYVKSIKNMKLIVCGHMHNGLVFRFIDKIIKNNVGLIAPNKTLFPNNARGIKEVNIDGNDISMVITGGITKIQESAPKILRFGDYLFSPQIDYIVIKKEY